MGNPDSRWSLKGEYMYACSGEVNSNSLNILNNYMILVALPDTTRITGTCAAPCRLYEHVFCFTLLPVLNEFPLIMAGLW